MRDVSTFSSHCVPAQRCGGPRRRRGNMSFEFALVALVFLLLMVGIMQFGLIYFTSSTVNNGVREGSRYAIVHPDKTDESQLDSIQAIVKRRTGGLDTNRLRVSVSFPDGTSNPNDRVQVSSSYQVASFLPGIAPFTVSKSSVMRIEGKLTPRASSPSP